MKVVLLLIATMGVSYSSACTPEFTPVCATDGQTYDICDIWCPKKKMSCDALQRLCKKNPGFLLCRRLECDLPKIQCNGFCPCVEPDKADDPKFETIIISE